MKKWISLILTVVYLFALAACGQEESAESPTETGDTEVAPTAQEERTMWTQPPELTVSCGGASTQALKCTYSWMHQNEDGTATAINACGSSPTQSKEHMQPLDISLSDSNIASLQFDLAPDSVIVRCWGQYDAESEEMEVKALAADFEDGTSALDYYIHLKEGSHIYEVETVWDSSEEQYGTVWYGFYTE